MKNRSLSAILLSLCVAALMMSAGCGSSGGTATPPPPPDPVAPPAPPPPPPPPPEPTFEQRLADWAAFDPNPCRAETPGFEALGGWLKDDGRALGESRVWIGDQGALNEPLQNSHGARVWASFTACAVRSTEDQYAQDEDRGTHTVPVVFDRAQEDDRDLIVSNSSSPAYEDIVLPEPASAVFRRQQPYLDGERDGQRILEISALGNRNGLRTSWLQRATFQAALEVADTALRIVVGGYVGEGDARALARDIRTADGSLTGSAACGEPGVERGSAEALCLFAPWEVKGRTDNATKIGTSHATPQVAAALDAVWAVWPDMDVLDLRNLAFDCAENMDPPEGESNTEQTYSYSNDRSFTSNTNPTWGHGILSLTCLFTANGGLQNPVTGDPISGGIYGPVAGPITGASIAGFDYTGRDFGYGFARPSARPNYALAATANLRPAQAISRRGSPMADPAAFSGSLWRSGAFGVDLTAAGNAIGAAAGWQAGNWTLRGGLAFQPEGAGSLTGSRAFRAPATASAAITAAYAKGLRGGFSVHLQADHWRTLAAQGRSLWENAELSESRISAGLARRAGRHEAALQAVWQSGVRGALRVAGRDWRLAGIRESGVWLTWRKN